MLQSNIISNLNKTLRSNFASPLDGSGGGDFSPSSIPDLINWLEIRAERSVESYLITKYGA